MDMAAQPNLDPLLPSSSTSASSTSDFDFEVFLSFRGEDTRKGFTGHLYKALDRGGINTFIDSRGLEKGEPIDNLLDIIKRSAVFVPIFSKQYAESVWCLKEITEMVKCKRRIIPVFFDVEPTNVRNQTGSFGKYFKKSKEDDVETLKNWKAALAEAANCSGYDLQKDYNGSEDRLIEIIVEDLRKVLPKIPLNVAIHPVGLDYHLCKMKELLQLEEVNEVRFVGICGIPGLGKTTIAKATYNRFYLNFQYSAFLENVSRTAAKGLVKLQKSLLSQLFRDKDPNISSESDGIQIINSRTSSKKILVILDDVDHISQLHCLVNGAIGKGSRVIITTKDRSILTMLHVPDDAIYIPDKLNEGHALELFSHFAFGGVNPIDEHRELLAKEIVKSIGTLPLVLLVLGSHFCGKKMENWGCLLKKLENAPHESVQKTLQSSYDDLERDVKQIFLDIACFFLGGDNENALYVWNNPDISLEVLEQKFLLKKRKSKGEFEMFDEIRDMGREIVRQEDTEEPWKRSRVWRSGEVLRAMSHCEHQGSSIRALLFDANEEGALTAESVLGMSSLKMLIGDNSYHSNKRHKLQYDFFRGDSFKELIFPRGIPGQLPHPKWLRWCHYPYKKLPEHIQKLDELVILELPHFQRTSMSLEQSENKKLKTLKVLSFHGSVKLKSTPDFSPAPCLKKLIFRDCSNLKEISSSIFQLENLTELDLRGCRKLKNLPNGIWQCRSLNIKLDSCNKLRSVPISRECSNITFHRDN